jgi:hypothetical protein
MQGGFNLASIRGITAARGWIVGAAKLNDIACRIFDHFFALDEVGIAEPDFAARRETIELARRNLHEVFVLDVKHPREGNFARAHALIFGVVDHFHLFNLIFGIVDDHNLERAKDSESTGSAEVQILPDRVLQQRHIDLTIGFRYANQLAEIADRFGSVTAPAQPRNGRHTRIIPTCDVTALD